MASSTELEAEEGPLKQDCGLQDPKTVTAVASEESGTFDDDDSNSLRCNTKEEPQQEDTSCSPTTTSAIISRPQQPANDDEWSNAGITLMDAASPETKASPLPSTAKAKKTKSKASTTKTSKAKNKKGKSAATATTAKSTVAKKKKVSVKAKKPSEKQPKAKKSQGTSSAGKKGSGTSKKGASKDNATNNDSIKSKGKAKGGKKETKAPESPEPAGTIPPSSDFFTKHYREFDRSIARLEKVDQFGFFFDPSPEEFVEDYTSKTSTADEVVATAESSCTAKEIDQKEDAITKERDDMDVGESDIAFGNSTSTEYPSHPPFNWEMVRRRRDQGRYIVDIQKREEQKLQKIAEYLNSDQRAGSKVEPQSISVLHPKGVDWDLFREDVIGMCDFALQRNADDLGDGKPGSLIYAVKKIKGALEQIYERTGCRHIHELTLANDRHQFTRAMERAENKNTEAAFQGKWRQVPFPERKYERLPHKNVVCAGLSELDERIAKYELRTSLPDSFVGLSYKYKDNTGKSEAWMKSVLSETGDRKGKKKAQEAAMALAEDEGVIRAQVTTCMEQLLIAVQDRVMTDADVLHQPELRSANWEADDATKAQIEQEKSSNTASPTNDDATVQSASLPDSTPDIVEQSVWGIDCYTRRNVSICLSAEFHESTALIFIEKWLLPAINACPVDLAHDIANAALILEGLSFVARSDENNDTGAVALEKDKIAATEERWSHSLIGKSLMNKIKMTGPPWLKLAARLLRRAREALGPDFFRVHPKGHGSIVLSPFLQPNTLVTFYRGEVYPSWRWGEKMDAIDITQARKKLKPNLPDFYNMALERPQKDPRKYGLLFVDASRKAGHGSSISHSCAPTCEVRVAALNGELCLAMTTLRHIEMGEELTFDYNAVTESLVEYRSAVCLCGYGKCRGSFLHFATADCYQQVLNRNSPITVRFASLAKACMKEVMSDEDERTLRNHGFMTAAFGAISVNRHITSGYDSYNVKLDSMDNVPIWLRTYVADTLRYIEYERRALPISLICDELAKPKADKLKPPGDPSDGYSDKVADDSPDSVLKEEGNDERSRVDDTNNDEKPAKGSKPMPTFFFYTKKNDSHFRYVLKEEGFSEEDLPGLEMTRAIKRIAATQWKLLSDAEKSKWKKRAEKEWEKQGGREKAQVEKKRKQAGSKDMGPKPKSKKARKSNQNESLESKFESSNISLQAADGEGVAAMEQRIQQLTQALSRVGRVLDRHRESLHMSGKGKKGASSATLRDQVHPPLTVATDGQVVAWMWNDDTGIVRTLLAKAEEEECVSPALKDAFGSILKKYQVLDSFGNQSTLSMDRKKCPIKPHQARKKLTNALMEFRRAILKDLKVMAKDLKKEKVREKIERKKRKNESLQAKNALSQSKATGDISLKVQNKPAVAERQGSEQEAPISNCEIKDGVAIAARDFDRGQNDRSLGNAALSNAEGTSNTWADVGSHQSSLVTPYLVSEEEVKTGDDVVADSSQRELSGKISFIEREDGSSVGDPKGSSTPALLSPVPKSGKNSKNHGADSELHVKSASLDPPQSCPSFTARGKDSPVLDVVEFPSSLPTQDISVVAASTEDSTSSPRAVPVELACPASPVAAYINTDAETTPGDLLLETQTNGGALVSTRVGDGRTRIDEDPERVVAIVIRYLVDTVVDRVETLKRERLASEPDNGKMDAKEDNKEADEKPKPWLKHYTHRFKLQAAADLLLMYAKTSTFFLLQPYKPLKSTPIEVYARELGNAVPRSVIDKSVAEKKGIGIAAADKPFPNETLDSQAPMCMDIQQKANSEKQKGSHKKKSIKDDQPPPPVEEELCEPDDIVSEVTVKYQGDYVLSQLLQWYNGGIGQSPGLPDMFGCGRLPSMSGCWERKAAKAKLDRPTSYELNVRPLLATWFNDPHQRGSPWPEELRNAFLSKESEKMPKGKSSLWLPFGSPVLDLLVTGDDSNITSLLEEFGADDSKKASSKGLLSTVDEGRPAQAVSNWVQCENPSCGKWRKIPWHVDIDVLAKKFVCSDNKWNKASNSCDAPEDEYEEADNEVVAANLIGEVNNTVEEPVQKELAPAEDAAIDQKEILLVDEKCLVREARFDVLRHGKSKYCVGVVMELVEENGSKKAKFHFPRCASKHDEYIEVGTSRIAQLYSRVNAPLKRKKSEPKSNEKRPRTKKSKCVKVATMGASKALPSSSSDSARKVPSFVAARETAAAALAEPRLEAAAATKKSLSSTMDVEGFQSNSIKGLFSAAPSSEPSLSTAHDLLDCEINKKRSNPPTHIGSQTGLPHPSPLEAKPKLKNPPQNLALVDLGTTKKKKKQRKKKAFAGATDAAATRRGEPSIHLPQKVKKIPRKPKAGLGSPNPEGEISSSTDHFKVSYLKSPLQREEHQQQQQQQQQSLQQHGGTSISEQVQWAADVTSSDVQAALAGLACLAGHIPRKSRDSIQQTAIRQNIYTEDNMGGWTGDSGVHYHPQLTSTDTARLPSSFTNENQQVSQCLDPRRDLNRNYQHAMDDHAQLQRVQEVQNAWNAEVQRQRLQQSIQEELQRQQRVPNLHVSTDRQGMNRFLHGSAGTRQGPAPHPFPNDGSYQAYQSFQSNSGGQHTYFPDYTYGYYRGER